MKQLILILSLLFSFSLVFSDPIEDMTREEAEKLTKYLKENPYIVDYCDCCDNNPGGDRYSATLILVNSTEIIPCSYAPERFSVKIDGIVVCSGYIDRAGKFENVEFQGYVYDNEFGGQTLATLNYHFAYSKNKVVRLGQAISVPVDAAYDCNPLKTFPSANSAGSYVKQYKKFLKKNQSP